MWTIKVKYLFNISAFNVLITKFIIVLLKTKTFIQTLPIILLFTAHQRAIDKSGLSFQFIRAKEAS